MRNGATEHFLAAAIFSGLLTMMMMVGAMVYAIFTVDDGTEITRTADNNASAQDEFDPNVLPAPAAGKPDRNKTITYDCKDMIYQTSNNEINYVREYGGVYNAAIVNGRFRLYKLDYGHLRPVDNTVLDQGSIIKLRYALENCNETYIRSGAQILSSATHSGLRV